MYGFRVRYSVRYIAILTAVTYYRTNVVIVGSSSNVPYSYGPRRPARRAPETSRPAWATQRTSQAGCRLKRQPPSLSDLHLTLPLCQPSRCSWQAGGSLEPAAQSSRKRRSKEACGAQPRLSARASLRRNAAAGADAVLAALAAARLLMLCLVPLLDLLL